MERPHRRRTREERKRAILERNEQRQRTPGPQYSVPSMPAFMRAESKKCFNRELNEENGKIEREEWTRYAYLLMDYCFKHAMLTGRLQEIKQ